MGIASPVLRVPGQDEAQLRKLIDAKMDADFPNGARPVFDMEAILTIAYKH